MIHVFLNFSERAAEHAVLQQTADEESPSSMYNICHENSLFPGVDEDGLSMIGVRNYKCIFITKTFQYKVKGTLEFESVI